jgi:N6-L-threonylcarbamoyladenine synthase
VSGGHNELILMKGHHQFETLGETLDDAAGEAFDKVARLLGLGYPGGPIISKCALKGDAKKYKMPKVHASKERPYDFSFSGLKSAMRRLIESLKKENSDTLSETMIADLCAGFQEAAIEALTSRLMHAVENYDAKEVHLAGGVSANDRLREVMKEKLAGRLPLHFPAKKIFCTDNGAMIAGAAYFQA